MHTMVFEALMRLQSLSRDIRYFTDFIDLITISHNIVAPAPLYGIEWHGVAWLSGVVLSLHICSPRCTYVWGGRNCSASLSTYRYRNARSIISNKMVCMRPQQASLQSVVVFSRLEPRANLTRMTGVRGTTRSDQVSGN